MQQHQLHANRRGVSCTYAFYNCPKTIVSLKLLDGQAFFSFIAIPDMLYCLYTPSIDGGYFVKTIKQIADEIGVSKQAVEKRIARNADIQAHMTKNTKGVKQVDADGEKLIKAAYGVIDTPVDDIDKTGIDTIDVLISMLKADLEEYKNQLAKKDAQIEFLQGQLNAARFVEVADRKDKISLLAAPSKDKPRWWQKFGRKKGRE